MNDLKNKNIGKFIKILRERNELTQEFVSEIIGISRPTLNKIEADKTDLSLKQARKISNLFNNSKYFKYPQKKYLPIRVPKLEILKAHEIKHIDEVLFQLSDKTAKELSDFSHKDVPWITAKDGEPIDYKSVFYRTKDYSVRNYE